MMVSFSSPPDPSVAVAFARGALAGEEPYVLVRRDVLLALVRAVEEREDLPSNQESP